VGFRGVGSANTNTMMSGLYFAEVCWSVWGLKYCQESVWVKGLYLYGSADLILPQAHHFLYNFKLKVMVNVSS